MSLSNFTLFGERFNLNARIFGLSEHLNGKNSFWYDVLQIHDTHGVPFDLIYQKLENNYANLPISFDEFCEFMKMVRYGAEKHELK